MARVGSPAFVADLQREPSSPAPIRRASGDASLLDRRLGEVLDADVRTQEELFGFFSAAVGLAALDRSRGTARLRRALDDSRLWLEVLTGALGWVRPFPPPDRSFECVDLDTLSPGLLRLRALLVSGEREGGTFRMEQVDRVLAFIASRGVEARWADTGGWASSLGLGAALGAHASGEPSWAGTGAQPRGVIWPSAGVSAGMHPWVRAHPSHHHPHLRRQNLAVPRQQPQASPLTSRGN